MLLLLLLLLLRLLLLTWRQSGNVLLLSLLLYIAGIGVLIFGAVPFLLRHGLEGRPPSVSSFSPVAPLIPWGATTAYLFVARRASLWR